MENLLMVTAKNNDGSWAGFSVLLINEKIVGFVPAVIKVKQSVQEAELFGKMVSLSAEGSDCKPTDSHLEITADHFILPKVDSFGRVYFAD